VVHFVPTSFTVLLQKDQWHAGFNGKLRNWVANFGEGAYTENGFGDNETEDINFGFNLGDSDTFEEWNPEDDAVVNVDTKAPSPTLETEINDDGDHHINGITEYGYGFWMRFLWNGLTQKLVQKGPWLGLARLSNSKDYEKDVAIPGGRTLALWVGTGFIHFTTYSINPGNNNIP
jgi:protein transport protein SEC24